MTLLDQSYVVSVGAMADTFSLRMESRLSFLDRFLHLSWESNEPFLGAARIISRAAIDPVSSAGKQFLHQN